METMLNRIPHSSLKYRRWNRNWLLGLKKCIMTNAAEMAIAISVAMAAPFIPQSNQKMKIGQYLASGYVTSAEVLNMIERIPKDSTSPLAYLLKSLENLKQERLYEQKSIAHLNAENYYSMKLQHEKRR